MSSSTESNADAPHSPMCCTDIATRHEGCSSWCLYCSTCCAPHTGSLNVPDAAPRQADAPDDEDEDAYDKRMLPHIVNAPDRIWLQTGCDDQVGEIDWKELAVNEVSWCWERIDRTDIEYVRADLAATPTDALCEKASILDCINQELRENEAGFQATIDDDPRAAIRLLVDAVRQKERRVAAPSRDEQETARQVAEKIRARQEEIAQNSGHVLIYPQVPRHEIAAIVAAALAESRTVVWNEAIAIVRNSIPLAAESPSYGTYRASVENAITRLEAARITTPSEEK